MQVWLAAPQNRSGPQPAQGPAGGAPPSPPQPIPATSVTESSRQVRRLRRGASTAVKDRALAPGGRAHGAHVHAEGLGDAQVQIVVGSVAAVDELARLPARAFAAAAAGDDEGGVV